MPSPHRKGLALNGVFPLLHQAWRQWVDDKASRLGAALAFYGVFSIAPFLVFMVLVGGHLWDHSEEGSRVLQQIENLIGSNTMLALESLMESVRKPFKGTFASVVAAIVLVIGTSGALHELQDGLNGVARVVENAGFLKVLRRRLLALPLMALLALTIVLLLGISSTISAWLASLRKDQWLFSSLWYGLDFLLSWGVMTFLLTLLYKFMSRARITWSSAGTGGCVAALLFTIGKFLLSVYLGRSATTYGTAGSFVVVLLWVYYSAMLVYYGAEVSRAYQDKYEA